MTRDLIYAETVCLIRAGWSSGGGRHEWAPTIRRHQRSLGTKEHKRKGSCGIRSNLPPNTEHSALQQPGIFWWSVLGRYPLLVWHFSLTKKSIVSFAGTSKCDAFRDHFYVSQFLPWWIFCPLVVFLCSTLSFHYTGGIEQEGWDRREHCCCQ